MGTQAQLKKSCQFKEDGRTYTFDATARIEKIGNQSPYFAITGEMWGSIIRSDRYWCAGGCMHDEVIQHFPEWEKYIRWHLTGLDGPMHYIANALYWAGHSGWCDGKPNSPPNKDYLYSTIVYGALDDDYLYHPEEMDKEELKSWLESRFPALMNAFAYDMNELFGAGTIYEIKGRES